jgi:rRNA maturation endonuclease Nob1
MVLSILDETKQRFVPAKYEDFQCPICGSTDYNQITKSNGILGPGGRTWLDHCVCAGCSVMFKDAEKFCKAGKREK